MLIRWPYHYKSSEVGRRRKEIRFLYYKILPLFYSCFLFMFSLFNPLEIRLWYCYTPQTLHCWWCENQKKAGLWSSYHQRILTLGISKKCLSCFLWGMQNNTSYHLFWLCIFFYPHNLDSCFPYAENNSCHRKMGDLLDMNL